MADATPAPGSIFAATRFVVNQKVKLVELTNEYAVFDEQGGQLAVVRQVGQSKARKLLRALSSLDQFLTHRLEIRGGDGELLLSLTRPAKVFRSTVIVEDAGGREVGRIVQDNVVGKIHFSLMAGDSRVGSINAENWRAWDFNVQDEDGREVARITKSWEGLARNLFTTADNYVVEVRQPVPEPLRSLVVASALTVDTALKQDNRGLN